MSHKFYGPGDPETWGDCRNHPNDPRTPDETAAFEEMAETIFHARMADPGWFKDALSEAPDLQMLHKAYHSYDGPAAIRAIFDCCHAYMSPSEEEVAEALAAHRSEEGPANDGEY